MRQIKFICILLVSIAVGLLQAETITFNLGDGLTISEGGIGTSLVGDTLNSFEIEFVDAGQEASGGILEYGDITAFRVTTTSSDGLTTTVFEMDNPNILDNQLRVVDNFSGSGQLTAIADTTTATSLLFSSNLNGTLADNSTFSDVFDGQSLTAERFFGNLFAFRLRNQGAFLNATFNNGLAIVGQLQSQGTSTLTATAGTVPRAIHLSFLWSLRTGSIYQTEKSKSITPQ